MFSLASSVVAAGVGLLGPGVRLAMVSGRISWAPYYDQCPE